MNLLKETMEVMRKHGKTLSDIVWVGSRENRIDMDAFIGLLNVEYDNGYGAQLVAEDLLVVGSNWWLERHEYDGSEWWEFKQYPKMPPKNTFPVHSLIGGYWDTLREINKPDEE